MPHRGQGMRLRRSEASAPSSFTLVALPRTAGKRLSCSYVLTHSDARAEAQVFSSRRYPHGPKPSAFEWRALSGKVSDVCGERGMDLLRQQILVLVEISRAMTAIPKKFRPGLDAATVSAACDFLSKARARNPGDKSLCQWNAEGVGVSWWRLRAMMDSICGSLMDGRTYRHIGRRPAR